MTLRAFLAAMIFILALPLALLHVAAAEVVGHFTQVEGRVDLLKGGQLPATPVKVDDGVQTGRCAPDQVPVQGPDHLY